MTDARSQETHSLWMGYALWLFGFLGAHRFYYGKRGSGLLYFFTLGLLGIGWVVDLFLMPSLRSDAAANYHEGQYDYDVAWLLHTFLGILGVQRMYLGKWVTGVLWLCTGGLFGFGYVYDYLTLNEQVSEANARR